MILFTLVIPFYYNTYIMYASAIQYINIVFYRDQMEAVK